MPATAQATAVNTNKVQGRRKIRYDTFDDLITDAEQLAASEVKTLGNWTYAQILDHLARSTNASIDGPGFSMPLPMRFVMRKLMMHKMVHVELPAGFKFPVKVADRFQPIDGDVSQALERLRAAIQRAQSTPQRALHPAFGQLSQEDWDQFSLRHSEMHMSFVTPGSDG